ncbi:MAG TPA: Maf family protein [Bacillota bacterium]|nr:Maf family protein [Bacillota bacterium]HQC36033.1 Maf family protein [Bacillota bacterium]
MGIILASGSPRRMEMIRSLGKEPLVIKPECDESLGMELEPHQLVMSLALKKGLWAEDSLLSETFVPGGDVLIAADTIVYLGGVIGKPTDEEDALNMLRSLSGRSHTVFSGVYVHFLPDGKKRLLWEATEVFVKACEDAWLTSYVATGEPMDKAGGYAIQGSFSEMIERIEGSYDNVVGLPLQKILATFPEISVL